MFSHNEPENALVLVFRGGALGMGQAEGSYSQLCE